MGSPPRSIQSTLFVVPVLFWSAIEASGQSTLPLLVPQGNETRIVRIEIGSLDRLPPELRDGILDRFDSCALDRDDDGSRHAVLLLNADELANLQSRGVPLEDAGALADHMRNFAPWNTLANKHIPSIEPILGTPTPLPTGPEVGDPRGAPPDCTSIGASLQPYNQYHNIDESLCFLQNLADAYPDIVRLMSIGQSVEGRDIWALKITDAPDAVETDEEKILLAGVTHAREWATHETLLYIAEYLTSRYATDDRVHHIVDHSVIWLVPIVNPDGYWYTWNGPSQQNARMWRKNRRVNSGSSCLGVDLNRNFAFKWGFDNVGSSNSKCSETYRGAAAASEPETQALQNLITQEKFAVSVSFHSYSQLWLYSWGYTPSILPESYSSMRAIGRKLAQLVYDTHGLTYIDGQSSYTIYRTNGDINDFAYGAQGTLAFTPEVRPRTNAEGGFLLPEAQIIQCAEESTAACLWLMDNVAGAIDVTNPAAASLFENARNDGVLAFSLPGTPAHQKPDDAFAMPATFTSQLTTRLDDAVHTPPSWGAYPADFEGCGAGSGYELHVNGAAEVQGWINAQTSYRALPYIFEEGAEVLLSNAAPGLNLIGIPSATPVPLAALTLVKRRLDPPTGDYGYTEHILEERSASEDAANPSPWINWNWEYIHPDGTSEISSPFGENTLVLPFRAYRVMVNVTSSQFNSAQESGAVYYLRFPATSLDCDRNGVYDPVDIASAASHDCNLDGIPDVCQLDCNGNGYADECDPVLTDVDYFVAQLLAETPSPADLCLLDVNGDARLDGEDVGPFTLRMIGE